MTKLAGYWRGLSVMASVIPRSRNTALATILRPISLGIAPKALRPSVDVQSYFSASSDFLMDTVVGICACQAPRLFERLHWPFEPSLKENATGVMASSVRVAQAAAQIARPATIRCFMAPP